MSGGHCARCRSVVAEQDLKTGRCVSLGAMVLCERCAAPAEEARPTAHPAKPGSTVQLMTPATSTMPAVVAFADMAVPIADSAFFKGLDAESLGSSGQSSPPDSAARSIPVPGKVVAADSRKATFAGVACGAGSFLLVLVVYVAFLRSAPSKGPTPVKANRNVMVAAKPELPPPTQLSVGVPTIAALEPSKPQLVASTSPVSTPDLPTKSPSGRAAEEAFEAIGKVPDSESKEKCRLIEAFLKEHEKADIALTARARVMLEKFRPLQVQMDFEGTLDGWEMWEGKLQTLGRKAHSGQRALISGPGSNGGGIWLPGIQPGKTYVVSFWSRRDQDVKDCYAGCEFGTATKQKTAKRDLKVDWTGYEKRTIETTAPPGSAYLYFWLWREKGNGEVCIDDVDIVEK